MVLAILVVIVASGLMMSVAAYAFAGHRGARFDRDHTRVVQGADAGVHEALYLLNTKQPLPPSWTSWASMGDARYRWRATSIGSSGTFQIDGEGQLQGVERKVTAVVEQLRPFQYAAFADERLTFVGSNSADSYSGEVNGWLTGKGRLGTNGSISLHGNATADGADVHNNPTEDPFRCTSTTDVCDEPKREDLPEELDIASDEALVFITDEISRAKASSPSTCPATPGPYVASSYGALARGTVYCFTTMSFDVDPVITGSSGSVDIYLTNAAATVSTIESSNHRRINCATCTGTGGTTQPDASILGIYTASYGPVKLGNNSHIAAMIYAPRASCRGNPSNAQTQFYGSLVCGTITNQGGWGFHYDSRLASIGVGGYDIIRWAEL